jgi:hypothetical protein
MMRGAASENREEEMIHELNAGFQHPIDGKLLDLIGQSPRGCRLQKLIESVDTITRAGLMYRLLRLEAQGIVRAERKPRNTTYFLREKNNKPKKGCRVSEARHERNLDNVYFSQGP